MLKFLKGYRLYSVLNNVCPSCHEGKYFVHKPSFNPKKFAEAREYCEVCRHKFEKEVGFFYGAMYAGYGLSVAIGVATFIAIWVLYPPAEYYHYIFGILIMQLVLAPFVYRGGRLIWMNLFTGYKGKKN